MDCKPKQKQIKMNAKTRQKVIAKMYVNGRCTNEEYETQNVPEDRIQMFIKGILLLEGDPTIEGQIIAREKAMELCLNGDDEDEANPEMAKVHRKVIGKLNQILYKRKLDQKNSGVVVKNEAEASAKSQFEEVKNHLQKFKNITSWEAFKEYGITRLSHYIYRLRKEENWSIETMNITETNRYGNLVTYAKYVYSEAKEEANNADGNV
jgi:hypothetical protein